VGRENIRTAPYAGKSETRKEDAELGSWKAQGFNWERNGKKTRGLSGSAWEGFRKKQEVGGAWGTEKSPCEKKPTFDWGLTKGRRTEGERTNNEKNGRR